LVAGLGNPGSKYKNTRHNVGFRVIASWAQSLGVRLSGRRFQSRNTQTTFEDKKIILLRPLTYMNQSGSSIRACVDFFDLEPANILIVHDDMDLLLGKIKVVRNGGAGGHKGVLSIMDNLGTRGFRRLKIGIGRPAGKEEPIEDYVLSPFCRDEKKTVERVIQLAVVACELFISSGIDSAMNVVNRENLTSEEVIN
jgi:PTH1 family peptidyl-tRNA hydrolase